MVTAGHTYTHTHPRGGARTCELPTTVALGLPPFLNLQLWGGAMGCALPNAGFTPLPHLRGRTLPDIIPPSSTTLTAPYSSEGERRQAVEQNRVCPLCHYDVIKEVEPLVMSQWRLDQASGRQFRWLQVMPTNSFHSIGRVAHFLYLLYRSHR